MLKNITSLFSRSLSSSSSSSSITSTTRLSSQTVVASCFSTRGLRPPWAPFRTLAHLEEEVRAGNRLAMSRAITLVESTARDHIPHAQALLNALKPTEERKSVRLGLCGPPGAGKSTFIEAFAMHFIDPPDSTTQADGTSSTDSSPPSSIPLDPSLARFQRKDRRLQASGSALPNDSTIINPPPGFDDIGELWRPTKVAVLAVDPSSSAGAGGSILGDKTRMAGLSVNPNAYVRPSPTRGALGGITGSTRDVATVVEAAGYDFVVIETVGVGQSEVAVADVVDMVALLVPPGGGDELQGLKKGVMEIVDMVLVGKADGDFASTARLTASQYASSLKFIHSPLVPDWSPPIITVSSAARVGLDNVAGAISIFRRDLLHSEAMQRKRRGQRLKAFDQVLDSRVALALSTHPGVRALMPSLREQVSAGELDPLPAVQEVLKVFVAPHE